MSDRGKRNRGEEDALDRAQERDREVERRALKLLAAGRDWLTAVLEATRQVDALERTGGRRPRPRKAPGRVNRTQLLDVARAVRQTRESTPTSEREPAPEGLGRPPRAKSTAAAETNRLGSGGGVAGTVFRRSATAAASADHDDHNPQDAATTAFSGSGRELPYREEMEAAFGTSFADVRVFTGDAARTAAHQIGAEAFAVGNQIAFATDHPGRELVAHELAHVVQARGNATGGTMSRPGDALEREADEVAARVAAGQRAFAHVEKYEGKSPAFGRARRELPARHRAPWGKPAAASAGTVYRKGTQITSLTITPPEITADGKATAKAAATTNPSGKTIEFSFDGPAFGSTIDASTGAIVAGASIAPEPKSKEIWVKAKADTATKKAPLTLWDEKYKKALDDYPKFIAGTYALPNFKPGVNGNFDALYTPAAKQLKATMRLKFDYTNDKSSFSEKMAEGFRRMWGDDWADAYAAAHGMWTVKAKADFERDFQAHVSKQWSDRYTFNNVREPKDVWGKLGPVHVNLDLKTVQSGEHFTVTAHKGAGRAEVVRPNMKLYEGDLTPSAQFGNTGADELGRLNAIMPKEVLFDFDKSAVKAADADKLNYTATYLRRATQPKFIIDLVGHSSSPGADKYNQKLSERRAESVKAFFITGGATAAHQVNASGVGEAGATKDPLWQKVDLTAAVDPAFVNKLDTAGHEFGHMLGVGDEYGTKGDKTSHWDLVKKAFGQKYADDVALKDVPGGGSIMRGGEEVRIYHYVTFWQALCEATLKGALPDPKFGYDDWKFNE